MRQTRQPDRRETALRQTRNRRRRQPALDGYPLLRSPQDYILENLETAFDAPTRATRWNELLEHEVVPTAIAEIVSNSTSEALQLAPDVRQARRRWLQSLGDLAKR